MSHELRTPPTGALPGVQADPRRLMQTLMNFGSNGIEYNRPDGEVTFGAALLSARYVRISVADTGVGVPPEEQRLLFQPVQRAGQELGAIAGTGLGLAISKRLAERMNGSIGFESGLGRGSVFWVDVPTYDADCSTSEPIEPPPAGER